METLAISRNGSTGEAGVKANAAKVTRGTALTTLATGAYIASVHHTVRAARPLRRAGG